LGLKNSAARKLPNEKVSPARVLPAKAAPAILPAGLLFKPQ
jgi:hypothetical protein